ncbi:hypothetical protein GS399_15265 [Pedobacter sp. HMF7647]|uniref:Uncharacterized protein n=1 Tax=Hufsiella arboris TaxID=2695275 RepID=A0A7K1YCM4_9SPHI|nr:hypothetical protein [Hufsiella arboris]MXV52333.1 hypothetical protein [Hufsiella arboris]
MRTFKSLLAGLGGALTLNFIHETVRHFDPAAPRVDKLGEQALSKSMVNIGINPPEGNQLYQATLAGDILSNALYYSLIDGKNKTRYWLKGGLFGLAAGIGALSLPEPLGLDSEPVAGSTKRKNLTVLYYVAGGLATAGILHLLNKKR